MKITFSQILIALMISGVAYCSPLKAQDVLNKKVSISVKNTTLLDVLTDLQNNNDVKFIYSKNAIDVNQKITVDFQNAPMKEVLDQVFKNNGIDYQIIENSIILGKMKNAQAPAAAPSAPSAPASATVNTSTMDLSVVGKVLDQTGQPVIGATILEKGTTNGVAADLNGSFKINVAGPGSVLVVASVGYTTQEITVGSQNNITITLVENVKGLNEVVVVGYGTQKRSAVTGAISSVKASDLQDQQVTRIDDALQGRASGVNVVQTSGAPGSAPTIRIRGITSINKSDPLYVIDGVVVDNGGIDNINPNDIESIDVLKDASAAIYGSRASNGVILVTTKKGRKGAAKVSYNGYVGYQNPVSKPQLTNATQYATLRNEAAANDARNQGAPYTPAFANPALFGTGTNWQNEIFTNALIQNHNLSVSGATDDVNYYTSFGYLDQQGIIDPSISNYKKATFTINTSYKAKKWLTIGENLTYTYTHSQSSLNTNSVFGGPLSSALNLDPLTPVIQNDPAGSPNPTDYNNQYAVRNSQGQLYGISNYVGQEITNPLAYLQTQLGNYNYANNLLGNVYVEISPIKGLKIRSQASGKQAFYGSDSFTPLYYLNSSTSNQSNTSQYIANNRNFTFNIDNTVTYTRSFGKNNFTVLIGQSMQVESGSTLGGTFIGEPVDSFNQASPNFSLPAANTIANGSDSQPYHLASTFGRLTYDYDGKYLFTGIIRHDGSSKFGSANVYGTFPSAELGYVLSKEDWFPKDTFVDFLKIRGSYGIVGNEMSLDPFMYTATIGSGHDYVFGNGEVLNIGYSPNAPANPNLKWEETKTANIGFDATLLNNLTVSVDVYKKLTQGMLEPVQLPSYAGFPNSPFANIGNMENKGIELTLSYNNHIGDFKYNVGGNISYNHNEVTSLGNQIQFQKTGSLQGDNSYEIGRVAAGQPYGEFYGFEELGVFHSQAEINSYKNASGQLIQPNAKPGDFKWADVNGDGKIDPNDRTFLGNPLPTFTYGVNFSASYHEFDLKLFGQGVWGNKIFQAYRRLDIPTANYPIAALNAWTPSNPNSNYPALTMTDPTGSGDFTNPSNFYLQNGAYFRIKTLQIGYTLPATWLKAADVQRVRVFIGSNNLVTITGYKGYDPEIGVGNNNQFGVDMGIYPQARTFMAGLDITL
ncbi:TonB-dependent receptor [Mucilaginibacter sp. McL0603]|uniref:TonB-dependent receptor n=1 Tax=Mucilaginibacter sp. McL0603 TaxID=3415670 RepID=UPI003CF25B51